jgi:protein subunit release factor A
VLHVLVATVGVGNMNNKKEPILSITKKDLEITYFSGTGKGGQHRNKHQNCVRIRHPKTGVIVTGTSSRSKTDNQKEALRNLSNHPEFLKWLKIESASLLNDKRTIEERVDEMMQENNLKIEYIEE